MRSVLVLLFTAFVACADPPPPHAPLSPTIAVKPALTNAVEPPPTSALVPVDADDPVRGPKLARVTVVIFSDFQCPFCARVAPTVAKLAEMYGDDLRVVWKDHPLTFHKYAREAALVGRAILTAGGSEAFWRFHDTVFAHQTELSSETLLRWANEANVGAQEIDNEHAAGEAKITASMELAGRLGVSGTPAFMIDGERFVGARSYLELAGAVDRHLAEAKSLEARGIARPAIYGEMVRAHFMPPDLEEQEQAIDQTVWKVEVGDAPVRGPVDALVTVVEFADFECPFCKRNGKTLEQLAIKYGNKLRFAFKHAPLSFHPRALPAAMFAMEARKQGGDVMFYRAHDALYASATLDDDAFARIAGELGLDGKKLADAVAKSTWKMAVDRDQAQGDDLEVRGAPCTFVNGRRVEGADSLAVFQRVVDEEIKKAEAKIATGVPAAKVYAETIAAGKGGPIDLPVPKGAPFRGGANARVVLQVFSDFQCPYCKRLEVRDAQYPDGGTGALAAVTKKYGDKIKVVWRDFPLDFHPQARPAATLAREALAQKGMATFWKVHDDLFAAGDLGEQSLEAIAKRHGVDWKRVKLAIDQGTWTAAIDADVKEGTRVSVTGTPTVFVNGRREVGAQPEAVLVRAIDLALALQGVK